MNEVRLIDADALKKDLVKWFPESALGGIEAKTLFKQVLHDIDNAPTVNYITDNCGDRCEFERPQGEWIKITREGIVPVEYVCSCCGRKINVDYERSIPMSVFYPYCHCDADMRGAE